MTKMLLLPAVVCVTMFALPALSAPPANPLPIANPRAALALLYRQMDAAASRRNAAARMAFCDAGFSRFPAQGKLYAYAEEQKHLARSLSALQTVTAVTRIGTVSFAPEGATVAAQETLSGTLSVPEERPGSALRVTRQVRDFWVHAPGGWKLKRRRVLSLSATVNGTPVLSNLPPH